MGKSKLMMEEIAQVPDHPVGSRWMWRSKLDDGTVIETKMRVIKVHKRAIKFECEETGMRITFYDKRRAMTCANPITRFTDEP